MASVPLLALSLADAGSIAGIVGTAVAVAVVLVGILRPTRKFLGRWHRLAWLLTRKGRAQIAQELAKERNEDTAKCADLQFELRSDDRAGTVNLVVHNKGLCSARNVIIWGELSPGPRGYDMHNEMTNDGYGRMGVYDTISQGSPRSCSVSVREWQIQFGAE